MKTTRKSYWRIFLYLLIMQNEILKTPNYYKTQLLSMMTDSDINEIVIDKYKEVRIEQQELQQEIKRFRWDNREILKLLSQDRQDEIFRLIKFLQFQLKQRDSYQKTDKMTIEEMKDKIDIIEIVDIIAWIHIENSRKLIQCPLPHHKDGTPSFKIFPQTDTFYCWGCKHWWDQINFIQSYYWITSKEAIQKFYSLIK